MSKITAVEILSKKTEEYFRNNINLYEIFHENTKLNMLKQKKLGKHIMGVINDKNFQEAAPFAYKTYTTEKKIYLPRNFESKIQYEFEDILNRRRSVRNFKDTPISLEQLSRLLYLSYGINDYLPEKKDKSLQMLRSVPSAGGLYPLEVYIMVMNVTGIEKGLYHYNVKFHALEELKQGEQKNKLVELTSYNDIAEDAAIVVFVTAMFHRLTYKYGDRGYRFIHIDAGHLGQNLYLVSTALNMGALALGGFYDDELNEYLEIDGITEAVVYEFIIGNPNLEEDFRLLPTKNAMNKER